MAGCNKESHLPATRDDWSEFQSWNILRVVNQTIHPKSSESPLLFKAIGQMSRKRSCSCNNGLAIIASAFSHL